MNNLQKHWRKLLYLCLFLVFGIVPMAIFGLAVLVGLAFNVLKLAFY